MGAAGISAYPQPSRPSRGGLLGLRLQIVLALAGLMLLAFVPLFFAVASLTRATIVESRERAARARGRAIAARVTEARTRGDDRATRDALVGLGTLDEVEAACVFASDGARLACVGAPGAAATIAFPGAVGAESSTAARSGAGRVVEAITPGAGFAVVTRLRMDDAGDRATPVVRLVALYMVTFGLALLVFAYFVLTRLIVRPVDQLVRAADRVANGARTLRVPRSGASELLELGASVQAMAERLISEEAALIVKVEELTQTTTRLTQTQAQLVRSERMASVGRLAAGVAHEIGNPIAALSGMQDLLLEGDLPRETQRDFLERMRRETERIHIVVRDLLDFARPEGDAAPDDGDAVPADVRGVVGDVIALVRPQKHFRSVRLDADVAEGLRVKLAAHRLTQVLLNVALNAGAALASASGGTGRVTLRARAEGARVRLEVEDDGPGIAPGVADRLFEPFVTTKDVGEGTGLGLAVCRGIVESAGGEIGVDASYRGGARFYVLLPAAP